MPQITLRRNNVKLFSYQLIKAITCGRTTAG